MTSRHAVYDVIYRVHLLDDDARRVHGVVETLECLGEAARSPPVGELLHRSSVVFALLVTGAERALHTRPARFTLDHNTAG